MKNLAKNLLENTRGRLWLINLLCFVGVLLIIMVVTDLFTVNPFDEKIFGFSRFFRFSR